MEKSFTEIVSTEIGKLLLPLRTLNSPTEVTNFVRELGWGIPQDQEITFSLSSLVSAVELALDLVTQISEANTEEEVIDLIVDLSSELPLVITQLNNDIPNLQSAISGISGLIGETANIALLLAKRITDYLVYKYLQKYRPKGFAVLHLLGIVELVADSSGQEIKTVQWSRIGSAFSNPISLFNDTYNWDTNFDGDEFMVRLDKLLGAFVLPGGIYTQRDTIVTVLGRTSGDEEIRIPLFQTGVYDTSFVELDLNISPIPASGPDKAGLFLYPSAYGTITIDSNINETWNLTLTTTADLNAGFGLEIRPPAQLQVATDLLGSASFVSDFETTLKIEQKQPDSEEIVIVGSSTGTHLYYKGVEINGFVKKSASDTDFGGELVVKELGLVIQAGDGDGFLQKILPDGGMRNEFDLGLGYSLQRGFYFIGKSAFEFRFASQINIGPVEIRDLLVSFEPSAEGIGTGLATSVKVELGPFTAVIEEFGLNATFNFPESGSSFGLSNIDVGFRPPKGIGMSLDAGVVKGGGYLFFDFDNAEYAGVLELTIQEVISVKAIGLLTTRMPDGSNGFSLLLIITAEFTPIQLGFGFTLNGVGGLIGVNRTMVLQALRDGVQTGSIDNIMFPTDPVANAPQIISDLRTIFPPEEGRYVFGPMGIIGWGTPTLISLEIGLMLEVPNPVRLAILGVLKAILPDEDAALLKLQVAFVGTIDFEAKYITFDASLFDSRLLAFTLEGDMALRIKWGNDSNFLFSVGGFHPQYTPPPLDLPDMKRLTISLLGGNNPRLTIESYFAVTSNTVQFGSRLDFYFKISGKIKVLGWLGFDALFQFSPFYFNISFTAGLGVYWKNDPIISISLTVMLEGPTPWHAKGTATFKILFIKCKVKFDKTWGDNANTSLPDKEVLPELREALENKANWLAVKPSSNASSLVTLKEIEDDGTDRLVIHPDTSLSVSQKVVPLDLEIEKFGNHNPSDYTKFHLDLLDSNDQEFNRDDLKEEYAPASFFDLTNTEKLSRPNFEKYNGGLKGTIAGEELTSDYFREREVEYEHILMDSREEPIDKGLFTLDSTRFAAWLGNGSTARSAFGARKTVKSALAPATVSVGAQDFAIVDLEDLNIFENNTATSFEEAQSLLQETLAARPELAGQLEVVPAHEIV